MVGFTIIASLVFMHSQKAFADTPTSQPWWDSNIPIRDVQAHGNNAVTISGSCTSCNSSTNVFSTKADGAASPNQTASMYDNDGWYAHNIDNDKVVSYDQTVFFVQEKSASPTKYRIKAMRNGATLWTTSINASCSVYTNSAPESLALGYDGNLYAIANDSNCSGGPVRIVSIDATNGSVRWTTSTILNGLSYFYQLIPYANGVAFSNNSPSVMYFNYSGDALSSDTFTPAVATNDTVNGAISVAPDGRTILGAYHGSTNVYRIFYKDLGNSTIHEVVTTNTTQPYVARVAVAPNGGFAIEYSDTQNRTTKYLSYTDSSGNEIYSKTLSTDSSGNVSDSFPMMAIDNTGNVLIERQITMSSSPYEQMAVVDSIDTTGAQTRVFNSEQSFGTSGLDIFTGSFSSQGIGNGKMYLRLCTLHNYSGSCSASATAIITVPVSSSFDYPRSVMFAAVGALDSDNDGLTNSQEVAQNTSGFTKDTDSDGLSDFDESSSNPLRNILFCNADASYCEYPSPTSKDLYVEVDWMVKPGSNGYSMKPAQTALDMVKNAYASHGITAHFDTGQLGGGNEIDYSPAIYFDSKAGARDFYDYKYGTELVTFSQFTYARLGKFHYLVSGYQYVDPNTDTVSTSTGASHPADDDAFIAYRSIKDGYPTYDLDTAVAGTIIHELGHNACLTNSNNGYAGQPASCAFAGVDAFYGSSYPSAMNYDYQLTTVNYSSGTNTSGDHNDWSTLRIQDFNISDDDQVNGYGLSAKDRHIKRVKHPLQIGPKVEDLRKHRDKR